MAGIELHPAPGERRARRVCAAMVRRGVLTRSMGDVITIVPPLTITSAEIDRIVDTLLAALAEVCA